MSVDGFDLTGRDVAGGITGTTAANAAQEAAQLQYQSAQDAIKSQKEFQKKMRKDLNPFRKSGLGQLEGLNALISDPNAQLNFIQNNPFFNHLANDAQNRLMSSQAARGRLGSGDTPLALQNALMLMGGDLVNQSIGQRMNMATMGQNAAAMQGSSMQNTSNNIMDLMTGGGNALASGIIGSANAMGDGSANAANGLMAGLGLMLSDRRMKCNLRKIGEFSNGIGVYIANYVGSTIDMVCCMAQEVEPIIPGAVFDIFGVKFMDYNEFDRQMKHAD